MEFGRGFLFVMILSVVLCTSYCDDTDVCCSCSMDITRDAFPPDFLFGVSSSSYQVYLYLYTLHACLNNL